MRLQGIAAFLFAVGSILLAAIGVALAAVFLLLLARFERVRRRQAWARSAFLGKLVRGLAMRRIRDIADVHDAYRAFFGRDVLRGSDLEEVAEFLQGAMRLTASTPQGVPQGSPQVSNQAVRALLAANQRALDVEYWCVPFSGTPEPERRTLRGLLELQAKDSGAAAARLNALARAVRIRQDKLERLGRERSRYLQWARWGWVGTLAFALASAILGILYLGW
jgi:hypothetical protein